VDVVRKGNSVIKRISLLMVAALMAAMMMVATAAPAFAAKACNTGDSSDNGCKTETGPKQHSGNSSADFNTQTTETQRGNTNAQGTQDTEIKDTTCTGPSGKELRADHPQCS
jgi:hypothetical protein